jgi:hypothetical protein
LLAEVEAMSSKSEKLAQRIQDVQKFAIAKADR